MAAGARDLGATAGVQDPLWFQQAVIYQLHVRSFADSDGDGIGDFAGLTARLDYLRDLGVTTLWLLPFYPSPLRDEGYDIADYRTVNPMYGTLADFRHFLDEAHRRGLRVITEVVINHTSDQHEWFQRSRRAAPGDPWRDFYVWSEDPTRYGDTRIIFQDFETSNWTWDAEAGAYFWHRFYHHQPDLNFDNPAVQDAVLDVVDFWLSMGVDGLRLDAIPYLFEREGTTCENLPETHAFLKRLRAHVDARHPGRMLLAEANQWPEETREYFGDGDECHMAFHFPVMPRLYMALAMEDRFPVVDILDQTPAIPANAQWATFLRNHDELTLEMVTEEERDYMWRFYAPEPRARINLGIRRRLAPLLGNDRRKIELLNGLLFSLPGTPVVYYGDEIGMGDNIWLGDRDGVRTPMQWSADRNAGFSAADPQRLYLPVVIDAQFRYENVNVQTQEESPTSLLQWMRSLIALRRRHPAFGRGDLVMRHPDNSAVLCYTRSTGDETVLVVANLSQHAQAATVDLADLAGSTPVEMAGRSRFPTIGESPYTVTLGPYGFAWFLLEPADAAVATAPSGLPVVTAPGGWTSLTQDSRARASLEAALPDVLAHRRWFAGKARTVSAVQVADALPVPMGAGAAPALLLLVDVRYTEGEPDTYVLPLAWRPGTPETGVPLLVLAESAGGEPAGVVVDGMHEPDVAGRVLELVLRRRTVRHHGSELSGVATSALRRLLGDAPPEELVPRVSSGEQSNSSVRFGERFILKLFRRAPVGDNPEWEVGRFLTTGSRFPHAPAVAGALELTDGAGRRRTIAVLHELVAHETDAWTHTLGLVDDAYDALAPLVEAGDLAALRVAGPVDGLAGAVPPGDLGAMIGPVLGEAALLGRRTAELHLALMGPPDDAAFVPEPMTAHYQRSLYQSVRTQVQRAMALLRRERAGLTGTAALDADRVLAGEPELLAGLAELKDRRIAGLRLRSHGDFHLGQVLWTGSDVVIIDFEGEPMRPFGERRLKRPPLRDVASMLRSYEYAARAGLERRGAPAEDPAWAAAAACWASWAGTAFLAGYVEAGARLLPEGEGTAEVLLRALLLEKAGYELGYELNQRPDWVGIPLHGMVALLPS